MENYTVKKIVNLPFEEIDKIQAKIDADNLKIIKTAYNDGRINEEECSYLAEFYRDGMGVYREVYRALYEVFKQPEYTCAIDLSTGKVDTDAMGNRINYGLKAVTPFTCTRLEYVDKFHNPIYVIFPKMKSAERAVEKIESEYNKKYIEGMRLLTERFFRDEDRDALAERMQKLPKSSTQLHDILRLTITCKYLSDVERIKRVMTENHTAQPRNFYINTEETRDLFAQPAAANEKKYYDIKMIMHQKTPGGKPMDVEVQLKIDTLYNADIRTHKIYEQMRSIESDIALNSSRMDSLELRQKQAHAEILKKRIRTINERAIHQYNMMVLDKARRIEDDGYRPLRVPPENADGTYNQCRSVIANEYMIESLNSFDAESAFTSSDSLNKLAFLRMIGKIDNEFDETAGDSEKLIYQKFMRLKPSEKDRFAGINEVAARYAPVIERKINARKKEEQLRPISRGQTR